MSCNKGRAFEEHGIGRYHAITGKVVAGSGSRLDLNVDYLKICNRHDRISKSNQSN